MKRELAKKAAKWWADKLRHGCFHDHGDYSETGVKAMGLAAMAQESTRKGLTKSKINKFERALRGLLKKMNGRIVWISVDYHPDSTLREAASKAGFDLKMSLLPWKTNMSIHPEDGRIRVSEGCGASYIEL